MRTRAVLKASHTLTIFLALTLGLFMLVGCSSSGGGGNNASDSDAPGKWDQMNWSQDNWG